MKTKQILCIMMLVSAVFMITVSMVRYNAENEITATRDTVPVFATVDETSVETTAETESPDFSGGLEAPNGDEDDIAASLISYIKRMNISGSVYIVDNGEAVIDYAQGDFTGKGSEIKYGVASVTKQITATCVMKLYEQNKLDIDDPIGKYFPEYRFGDHITIRQLLCQRSGIPDYSVESEDGVVWVYTDNSGYMTMIKAESSAEENREIIRNMIFDSPLLFEPESEFYYSDSNYALLATIVKDVSGMDFHEYARQNIFEPLGMTASFIDDYSYGDDVVIAGSDREEFDDYYFLYKGAEYGCGDMLASPEDLYKWYKGFTGGKIVSKSAYNLMTKNYSDEGELGYGFGLMISETEDTKTLYHYGFIPSYYSAMFMIPEHDLFITVLANHAQGYPHTVAANIVTSYTRHAGYIVEDVE